MAANSTPPPYVVATPIGFHANDILQYLRNHPTNISSDPKRREWATQKSLQQVSCIFPGDAPSGSVMAGLMIYNKSRDVDRVCPSCHRIYRVGEAPRAYQDFQEFFERPKPDAEVDEKTMQEQDMSGICCGPCFNALSDKPWQANGCGAELAKMRDLASSNGFTIRPSRPEEQWESGLKIVWEKLGN